MKLYFFLLILASFLLGCISCREGDDITAFGTIQVSDKLLYSTNITRPSKSRRGYITYDFNFQSFGSKDVTIHAIKVLDKAQDRKRATVTLTKGGPGYKSVDLHFESERGGGIFKMIEIYGH